MYVRLADRPRNIADGGSAGFIYWVAEVWDSQADFLTSKPAALIEDGIISVKPGLTEFVTDVQGRYRRISDGEWIDPGTVDEINVDEWETVEVAPEEQILRKIRRGLSLAWGTNQKRGDETRRPGLRGESYHRGKLARPSKSLPASLVIRTNGQQDRSSVVGLPKVRALMGLEFDHH